MHLHESLRDLVPRYKSPGGKTDVQLMLAVWGDGSLLADAHAHGRWWQGDGVESVRWLGGGRAKGLGERG
jgi:hypothetical protein